MTSFARAFAALVLSLVAPVVSFAQCSTGPNSCSSGVPRFVKAAGLLKADSSSRATVVAIKFTIYDDSTAGNALWQEIQNIRVDDSGRYEVMLGVTSPDGMPPDIFSSGSPRWLGAEVIRPGSTEESRTLMVSVPYAMEAANAQTLGGLPASAFARANLSSSTENVLAAPTIVAGPTAPASTVARADASTSSISSDSTSAIVGRAGPVNVIPKFSGGGLASSQITDSGGVVTMQNLSNVLFADQYSGGVPDAVAACPSKGCIIYALSPNVNLNLGTLDPGTKSITIYLGPYTYNVKQVVLRRGMKIIGMGASAGFGPSITCTSTSPCNGTALQSTNGNNPVFVIPQTNNTPTTNVHLSGFRVFASSGNTSQDGFLLDTSSTTNSGLWYSTIEDIYLEGFAGIPIHVKGRSNDFASLTQWVFFNNVIAFRAPSGPNALRLEGGVFQLRFRNCEFDGQGVGDGTDIYLGGTGGGVGGYPISITFEGLIAQAAATGVQLDGAYNITFYNSHHERLWGGYHVTNNTGIGTRGLVISDSYFSGDAGTNGGAGYDLKIDTTVASGVVFARNQMFGNPDAVIASTNLASVAYQDNLYAGSLNAPPTTGITPQMNPATSINALGVHSIGLNASSTPISIIQSTLGPGEFVTFYTLGGQVTFAAGGNIDLMGATSINVNGSITLVRSDLGGSSWKVVSQWTPPSAPASPPGPGVATRSEHRSDYTNQTGIGGMGAERSLPN